MRFLGRGFESHTLLINTLILQNFPVYVELDHFLFRIFFSRFYFPVSGLKPWTQGSVDPSFPQFLRSIFIAHNVQQFRCLSIFHRVLLTPALALSASQLVPKKTKAFLAHHTSTYFHLLRIGVDAQTNTHADQRLNFETCDRLRLATTRPNIN